jgi:hypothetical protein
MTRDYDATPVNLFGRAESWYELVTTGITNIRKDFSLERYVAFCFSLEFLLKALICIDKNNAQTDVLQKYGHKIGTAKSKALTVVQDETTKDLVNQFFSKYPEFEDRDVITTRYGVLGSLTTYDMGALTDSLYKELLQSANKTIHTEWTWRNGS